MKKVKNEKASDEVFNIARVTRVGGVIVNIEVADQAWIDANEHDPYFIFPKSPDADGNFAIIGLHYDDVTGLFEKPAPVED